MKKWLLVTFIFALSGIASAQEGPSEPHDGDEDCNGNCGPISCPNPEDAAPGCRSDAVAIVKEKD